jgi:hypothetical protein
MRDRIARSASRREHDLAAGNSAARTTLRSE